MPTTSQKPKSAKRQGGKKAAKPSKPSASLRGEHIMLKDDIDAWKAGAPSKRAKRNARIIDGIWKLLQRIEKIQMKIESDLEFTYFGFTGKGYEKGTSGITLYHPDKTRRIQWEVKNINVLNENAERAISIIQEYVDDARRTLQKAVDSDMVQFLEFLLSMQDRRSSKVKFTPQLVQFMKTSWSDERLRMAAQLLNEAFEPNRTKMYVRLEELQGDIWLKRNA